MADSQRPGPGVVRGAAVDEYEARDDGGMLGCVHARGHGAERVADEHERPQAEGRADTVEVVTDRADAVPPFGVGVALTATPGVERDDPSSGREQRPDLGPFAGREAAAVEQDERVTVGVAPLEHGQAQALGGT